MAKGFYYDILNPPEWCEADQKYYPYRLKEEWVEQTELKGLELAFPADSPYVTLSSGGFLTLKPGYLWDGPSGIAIDTADFMRGSAVHDGLYQLEKKWGVKIRKQADKEMLRIIKEDGMGWIRRTYCWLGVRVFGGLWNLFG